MERAVMPEYARNYYVRTYRKDWRKFSSDVRAFCTCVRGEPFFAQPSAMAPRATTARSGKVERLDGSRLLLEAGGRQANPSH